MSLPKFPPMVLLVTALVAVFIYLWALLHAESQLAVGALLLLVPAALFAMRRLDLAQPLADAAEGAPKTLGTGCVIGTLALVVALYDQHFALLLLASVLLYTVVGLGMNLQFGYAGIVTSSSSQRARSWISSRTAAEVVLSNGTSWWIASTRSMPAFRSAVASSLPTSRSPYRIGSAKYPQQRLAAGLYISSW